MSIMSKENINNVSEGERAGNYEERAGSGQEQQNDIRARRGKET